jgi:hypothetical protein
MKKVFVPIVLIAAFFAFYTPKEASNYSIYIKVAAIIIVMIGVMKLMQKVPSRNQENNDDEI